MKIITATLAIILFTALASDATAQCCGQRSYGVSARQSPPVTYQAPTQATATSGLPRSCACTPQRSCGCLGQCAGVPRQRVQYAQPTYYQTYQPTYQPVYYQQPQPTYQVYSAPVYQTSAPTYTNTTNTTNRGRGLLSGGGMRCGPGGCH